MAFNFETFGTKEQDSPTAGLFKNPSFDFQSFKGVESQATPTRTANVPFPAVAGESPIQAGLKATGNVPASAFNLGKGIFDLVTHPIETIKGGTKFVAGAVQKLIPGRQASEETFDAVANALKERYGSLENLQRTATEDPFGFGADILSVVGGGAALAGKAGTVGTVISKTADIATAPVRALGDVSGKVVGSTARFGSSQLTGLNPTTINEIIKNPNAFKTAENAGLRTQVAEQVATSLDKRLEELSSLGKEYDSIRQSNATVQIPAGTIETVLNKYGVKLNQEGRIVTSPESRPLSSADKNALQDFIDNYGREPVLTANSFLNTREALSQLSRFEAGKTQLPQLIARDLRSSYDTIGKKEIPGLAQLDTQFAPERQLLGQLKRDIFDSKGNLKDGAISKIANITGKGKEKLLERMKEVVPDIEERVRILKAVEDIENASGLKVGTYTRAAVGVGGALSGNIPVVIGAILSQPEVAVPILRAFGLTGQKAIPVLKGLRGIAEDVNNFRIPTPLIQEVQQK